VAVRRFREQPHPRLPSTKEIDMKIKTKVRAVRDCGGGGIIIRTPIP
jgi:hypothetical protein